MVNDGMAHTCERNDNDGDPRPTTVSCCVSLTEISTRVALVAGLALFALLVVAWRKPARPVPNSPRTSTHSDRELALDDHHESDGTDLAVVSTRKKALETMGLGAIAIFGGIAVAIVVSVAIAWIVTNFLNRL